MPNDLELFDEPPRDGGVYLKRKDGQYQRIEAATVAAPVGATHAARRNAALDPSPVLAPAPDSVPDWRAARTVAVAMPPDAFTDTSDSSGS